MRLACIGVALTLGAVSLWLFEFNVLSGGVVAVLSFLLLTLLVGFPSAFSEASLSPLSPTLPGSLRSVSRRLEILGWLALVNAIWISSLLSIVAGLLLAGQSLISTLPWPAMLPPTYLTVSLLWFSGFHRAVGFASFWATAAVLAFVLKPSKRAVLTRAALLAAAASLMLVAALNVALPGGVNPGINYVVEAYWPGCFLPLLLSLPVLGVGAGMGVLHHHARGEEDVGFQATLYPLAVIGLVFLSSMAFFSGGGASGLVDAERFALPPVSPLGVFSWWLASSATLSTRHGLLGRVAVDCLLCVFTIVSAMGVIGALASASSTIKEELGVGRSGAITLSAAPAATLSLVFTLFSPWTQLVFLYWWFAGVNICLVALAEVVAVGWVMGVSRPLKQLNVEATARVKRLLDVILRFAATPALLATITLTVLSALPHVYLLAQPLTPLTPLPPQDVSAIFTCSTLAWLSSCFTAAFTLKWAAERRRSKK